MRLAMVLFWSLIFAFVTKDIAAQHVTWNGPALVDSNDCTCAQINSREIQIAPGLIDLASYEQFHNISGLNFIDGREIYESIFVLDLQMNVDPSDGYYTMNLISFKKLWITDSDDRLRICLNPCIQEKSEIPISIRYRHEIAKQHGWAGFEITDFDSTTAEFAEIIRSLFDPSDEELIERYIKESNTNYQFDMSPLSESD